MKNIIEFSRNLALKYLIRMFGHYDRSCGPIELRSTSTTHHLEYLRGRVLAQCLVSGIVHGRFYDDQMSRQVDTYRKSACAHLKAVNVF